MRHARHPPSPPDYGARLLDGAHVQVNGRESEIVDYRLRLRSNGRQRSRRFIEFLRGQFPQAPELKREESRIIVP